MRRLIALIGFLASVLAIFCLFYLSGIALVTQGSLKGLKTVNFEENVTIITFFESMVHNPDQIRDYMMSPFRSIGITLETLSVYSGWPSIIMWIVIILLLVSLIKFWLYLYTYKDYMPMYLQAGKRVIDKKNTFGSAVFASEKDIKSYAKKGYLAWEKGIPLGLYDGLKSNKSGLNIKDIVTISETPRLNSNVFVYAPPGEGKTFSFVKTVVMNILSSNEQYKSSFILNDSKGDIYKDLGGLLEKKFDYKVVLINLISLKNSNHFNPLDFIDTEQDAQIIVDMILKNTKIDEDMKGSSDPFWSEAEEAIFISTILLLKMEYKIDASLGMVYDFLNDNSYVELHNHFEGINDLSAAKRIYKSFLKIKEEHRGNMIFGLCTRLKLFALDEVREFTSHTDFDIYDLKRKHTAIFFVIPDTNTTMNYLLVVIKAILAEKLIKYIDGSQDHMIRNRKIIQIDDEIANTGIIPQYKYWINTFRSRNWILMPIFQNLNQPKELFGHQWISVYNACHTKVVLGVNDPETADFVSKELGTQSIRVMTKTKDGGLMNMYGDERWSQTDQKVNLLNPDEIQRMDINQQIVLRRGCLPLKLYKLGWDSYKDPYDYAMSHQRSIFTYSSKKPPVEEEFDFSATSSVNEPPLVQDKSNTNGNNVEIEETNLF